MDIVRGQGTIEAVNEYVKALDDVFKIEEIFQVLHSAYTMHWI